MDGTGSNNSGDLNIYARLERAAGGAADDDEGTADDGDRSSDPRDRDDDTSTPRDDDPRTEDDPSAEDEQREEDERRPDEDDDSPREFKPVSLSELAEQNGTSLEELMDRVTHTFTVDGEEMTVPVSELIRGHQRERTFHQRMNEVEQQRTQLSEAERAVAQDYQDRLSRLSEVTQLANRVLVQDINSPDMQALRASNPAEWSARFQEIQLRQGQLQEIFNAVASEQERTSREQKEKDEKQFREALEKERAKLLKAIPHWDDALKSKIGAYARSLGFSDQEVNSIADHRLLVLADKARRYDDMVKGRGKGGKPKPTPEPKSKTTLNPRKTTEREAERRVSREEREERARLRKSGKLSDAAAILDRRFG